MSATAKIKFHSEWGDHQPGAVVEFAEPLARHIVDLGLARFVAADEPATPSVESSDTAERADAKKADRVQRATK
jgi:hypothetical protein